ncbi:MAG: bifunctional [glutamate--ammonia ligase]-adenylyl-L-tyrosine phosphorylase/[glutamate--ammonia-ligase] adenylyltransferase [Gallionella sp.]|jgi:glutamate-ammonia-ligase adenylyltransferase|nr:bifunctional [glutamate--ammonia ligase]-adenylyl-L-tyrosine phosphorylase/[glutamate--ammonia-ligase] adenylyltransferase [Gallionella sp.]MCK9355012.1 bifunctional [glutamate--ammonia ligase]-adenylyl-L-tyrosine phosphorylase/[glutamate--ammonia-ligase] adenylyltransferase [Gallionella sp.]
MNTSHPPSASFADLLQHTVNCSRYARHILKVDPDLLNWLQANYAMPCDRSEMLALLQQSAPSPQPSPASGRGGERVADATMMFSDETELSRAVRRLRKQVMVKLILRDLNGLCDLNEVMQAMTALAEVCVRQAQACLMRALQEQYGSPIGEASKTPQELLVIGMGKLGGGELNVSSDIDLIFVYPEDGETDGARALSNHEFFTKLGRRLINAINDLTADGYVFRVDMRLRPYGDSGPLVMSFAALEEYLVSQGREWERYAWIKARVISPAENPHIDELSKLAQPFVFRKYLDFGAIDSMRKLHAQIRQEVQRRDRLNNIKLGPGGIREIEFTAQVFQLIRGGRDARLRIRPTQQVLQVLVANGQLDAAVAAGLDAAYIFLRNLEHRLQYLDDQQTQEMPEKPEDQAIIAAAMGYADYAALLEPLAHHRALVTQQFEHIFGEQKSEQNEAQTWREGVTVEELTSHLTSLGYRAAPETAQRLLQLREGIRYRQLPDPSRQRLDKLIPQFIAQSAQQGEPDATLARSLTLLEGVSRRAAYLAFLSEYPQALQRLVRLIAASSWVAEYLTQHPALLDELLDAREMYRPPQWQQIDADLQQRMTDSVGDTERQLDVLRQAQQEQTFHLLAMDLQGLLPLEKLSDHLSDLADLMLRHVLKLSWETARKRHCEQPKFAIIAYGKLGGKELGYASDLDLIFLYDDDHPDAQENYARLAQRINTVLGSHTASGRLYETDLRLRPNGASGLLVSSVAAFAEYQHSQAWVWEHQALTRARFSAGDSDVGDAFERIRRDVLCQPRDLDTLRREILAMRQKMLDGHPNDSELFDIKHDRGGMVDIEFMVQFLVLAHAQRHPQLTANIGNLALLKLACELELIPAEQAERVRELYRSLRQTQHRMRLNSSAPCRIEQGVIDTGACKELWELLLITREDQ